MRYLVSSLAVASGMMALSGLATAQSKQRNEKLPLNLEINKEDKSATIPLTSDGNNRIGVKDFSKDPTRENPQGEKGGAIIFERRF